MSPNMIKTCTFAVLHFSVGFAVSYAFTGSIALAGGIALAEPLANTVVFYCHERAWNSVQIRSALSSWARRSLGWAHPAQVAPELVTTTTG
jgi:uncharacterized membrane protein